MAWTAKRPMYNRLIFFRQSKFYRQSRREFYEGRNVLTSSSSFSQVFAKHRLESLETSKEIRFYGLEFNCSSKACIRRLGKPNYIDSRSLALKGQNTYFYRLHIKGVKCILQIHFYQDVFFFSQMEIREGNAEIKKEIRKLLCQKYEIEPSDRHGVILDKYQNQLVIKEDIVPSIAYITGNREILEAIRTALSKKLKQRDISFNQKLAWLLDVV